MANNLKFYGEIREVLPQQTGVSKAGKQWWSQSIIVEETDAQYPSVAIFTLVGKSLNDDNVPQMYKGNKVTVSFNIGLREWMTQAGKRAFSTELQAWRLEPGDTTQGVAKKTDSGNFQPTFAAPTNQEQVEAAPEAGSDLPF